jgi:hypothetical protein
MQKRNLAGRWYKSLQSLIHRSVCWKFENCFTCLAP